MENDIPVALYRHIQHHPMIDRIVILRQAGKLMQLRAFQLRHKPHGADVDTQNGYIFPGGCLGHMQNGAVPAKADHQLRVLQFPVELRKPKIPGQFIASVHLEGQAEFRFHPRVPQNLHCSADGLESLVPVWIRC